MLSIVLALLSQLPALAVQSVVLTWNPSTNTDVAGYNIYFGTESHVYTNTVQVGNVTNTEISGLLEGTTYYFSATSYDSSTNQSPFSNETFYSVPAIVITPPVTNQPVTNPVIITPPVTNSPSTNPVVVPPVTNITTSVTYPYPTLDAISNLNLDISAASQTVGLAGITSGTTNAKPKLKVTAVSSNPGLAKPEVTYTSPNSTGKLTFKPTANATGTAVITVTVNNGATNYSTTTRSFTVTVTNAPPTINPVADLTMDMSTGSEAVALSGITSGFISEKQTLKVTAVSSNPGVVKPTVSYGSPKSTGTVTLKPVADATGSSVITLTVNDGNLTAQTTFTVTVTNAPPTINPVADLTMDMSTESEAVALSGITSGSPTEKQTLKVTAVSSNPGVVKPTVSYGSPKATGTVTLKPVADVTGSSVITVTVNDGNLTTQTSFNVTVTNAPPTINPVTNLAINENAASQAVALTGITSGSPTEKQTLKVTAVSSNPGLIMPTVSYSSPKSTGTVTFKPVANTNGTSVITVTVNDGNLTTQTSFTVTVAAAAPEKTASIANVEPVAPGVPATISSVGVTNGHFGFQVTGSGQYVVEATGDLINWSPVETNTAPFTFSDSDSANFSQRYYRVHTAQ